MNPILLLGAGGAAAWAMRQRFENRVARDLRALSSVAPKDLKEARQLPERARRMVQSALPDGASAPRVVRLTQTGDYRYEREGAWTPFEAVQDIAVGHVGYLWRAQLSALGVLRTDAVDSLVRGSGRLEARLIGLWPLPVARGKDVTRAQVFRYLAELPWAPHAVAGNPDLNWRDDDGGLSVTATDGSRDVTVRFEVDERGNAVEANGMRPRIWRGQVVDTAWNVSFRDYDTFDGARLPTQLEARWDGDAPYVYLRARVRRFETI